MTKEERTNIFFRKLKLVHGDKYGIDKVNYINNKTKIILTCPKHGNFEIRPDALLAGQGCSSCAQEQRITSLTKDNEAFLQEVRAKWGDTYDLSLVKYAGWDKPIDLICREHGKFTKTALHFLQGQGCQLCSVEARRKKRALTKDEFIERAKVIHGDKYDYSLVNFVNEKTEIDIICPAHGKFSQTPDSHLHGSGCPQCGNQMSKAEDEIADFIKYILNESSVIQGSFKILDGLQIDIYIPKIKLGIEFNGLHWHTEEFGKDRNYHLNKTLQAKKKGVKLIHIFEDEWLEHKELVLDKIAHMLHANINKIKIGGRKCKIQEINKMLAKPFLTQYHIQGWAPSTVYYGAFFRDKLVGVMSFKRENIGKWNLNRFTTHIDYSIPGLASKLFKHFTTDYQSQIQEVKTFLDRRWSWSNINVYDKMGFTLDKIEGPDYRYVIGNRRIHKFNFRKQFLHEKYGLPLTITEKEMSDKLDIYRIWDCGLFKYVWKNETNS